MTYLDSIILGVVEGVTEFLPISSTGHLILAGSLLGVGQGDFVKSFEIVIQLGAILAIVVLYWRSFLERAVLVRVATAFVPTAVLGFILYHFAKQYLLGNVAVVLSSFFWGGLAIIGIEYLVRRSEKTEGCVADMTLRQSFLIGIWQAIAIIPGVSRSGATVMGGLLMGIPRAVILEFSFLLAVPTMLAATGYDIVKNPSVLADGNLGLLAAGFVTAFIVAFAVVKLALGFVRKYSFVPFGIYRIAAAVLFYFFFVR